MTAAELVSTLVSRGVRLQVNGDRLVYTGPSNAVTPELKELLRSHKAEVIELLAAWPVCPTCHSSERCPRPVPQEGGGWSCAAAADTGASPGGADGRDGAARPEQHPTKPPCSICKSTGRCQGRVVMPGGGWVCLAAVADGVLRNGRLHGPGRPPAAEGGR